jgi:RND superfamily putative drug exporter
MVTKDAATIASRIVQARRSYTMATLTRWILSHRRLVVVFWLVVLVVGLVNTQNASNALSQKFDLPGREGFDTNIAILHTYGNGGTLAPLVPVITLRAGVSVDSVRPQLAATARTILGVVPRARIASYASTGDRVFVSRDGHSTYLLVFMPPYQGPDIDPAQITAVRNALAPITIAGAHFDLSGFSVLANNGSSGTGPGVLAETLLGGVGALVVLAFVFGSGLAIVPMGMAIVTIPTTFLLVWGATRITDVTFIVEFLIALIGLGVAIDYSLLIVMRWREERAHGLDNAAAVQKAMESAGRAVVFSGTTVAVSLLSLVVLPVPFLRSVGYGGMLIPLVSVVVAITLLPVVLATIGPTLDWPHRRRGESASRFWSFWGNLVVHNRVVAAVAALAVLVALLAANTALAIGVPKADSLSGSGQAYAGLQTLERSGIGPGVLSPYEVLLPRPEAAAAARRIAAVRGVIGTLAPTTPDWQRGGTALVDVLPSADASTAAGRDTLGLVRTVVHTFPGARYGGPAVENDDFTSAIYGNFPLMVVLIALLTYILLARAFRSLLLPLKALVLNVLSVGATWGVLVLVWQEGHGSQQIWGIPATNALTVWIPLMVFAFLFGLSMDYEVFILARMREEYDAARDTNRAVVTGIARTGRLVTSAALILFLAFVSLASGPETDIKVFATGLAAGILLDATVVRALLVPALVSLVGRWNWWLPQLPARLLRVQPSLPPLDLPHPERPRTA